MRTIVKRLKKTCAICERDIKVIIYSKKDYRGGHYFGKIGICTEKAEREALKAGTREWNFHGTILHVMKKDPIPYKYLEYWECPRCYWGSRWPKQHKNAKMALKKAIFVSIY